jgi:hypothetical protein
MKKLDKSPRFGRKISLTAATWWLSDTGIITAMIPDHFDT